MSGKFYKYPKTFTKCRACGCKDELVEKEFNHANKDNKKPAAAVIYAILLEDPTTGIIKPIHQMLMANIGICSECGTARAKVINELTVSSDVLKQLGPQMPPGSMS